MVGSEHAVAFRPTMSLDDWTMILSAIRAYSHNAEYRELLVRFEREAKISGIVLPIPRPV
jgi:hypothetical protein